MTLREIAAIAGCSFSHVSKLLVGFGVKTRRHTPNLLKEKTCEFCGDLFPVGGYGQPRTKRCCSKRCARSLKYKDTLHNREWLEQKYIVEELSSRQIARLIGSASYAVDRAVQRFGFNVRTSAEARKILFDRRGRRFVSKQEMVDAYGGKCACCGENELAFLSLDHIGGGGKHRLSCGRKNHVQEIRRQLKAAGWPKDKYRLLCMNCNFATSRGRTCPHQLARAKND